MLPLVAFIRGVNVGGHRRFRPTSLVEILRAFDIVNIGAAGTLIVRQPRSGEIFERALRAALPFEAAIALCDDLIADLVLRSGAAGRVRSILSTDVAERLSFAAVANLLKTTARTLRRQLRLQNTSFRELSDELRVHVALRYLRETTMSMEDIAFALGFSDSANFRHAFRRWTGKAPHEYRRGGGASHLNSRPSNTGARQDWRHGVR